MKINLSTAEAVIAEAKEAILSKGLPAMAVVIVDGGGHLVALCRLDGALDEATDIAHHKARTAALVTSQRPVIADRPTPRNASPIKNSSEGPGQGVVLRDAQGKVIGAVGVSGGSTHDEEFVAKRAAVAIAG
jgi:uncharacterized protein GlcG (DUF336 family)